MENNKYNVIILKTESSESVVTKFSSLFKIPVEKASAILQKESFVIKKQTDKATAEKFHKAIVNAGINCNIEEIIDEEDIALPTIEVIESDAEVKPLTDITRPEIEPLHSKQMDLSLEARPVDKSVANEEKVFETINQENYCPDCGTIRASADSACLHCDYDPEELKRNKTRATIKKAVVAIIILIIAVVTGLPFYQQYTKRMQLIDDLKLAFDTRNKVTDFIQQTNFWPNQNIDAGLDKKISNQTIKSVTIGKKSILTVVIRARALEGEEKTLILTPNVLKGQIVWNCLSGSLQEEFRPDICKKQ